MDKIINFFKKNRILISRIAAVAIVAMLLGINPTIKLSLFGSLALWALGFVLVLVCTFGRLWALAYISGHKTNDLIEVGPYSMVRNPLYLFSLIGAIGIGLASRNVPVLIAIVALFAIYYPFVIKAEEDNLSAHHGHSFNEFRKRVPMFMPRLAQHKAPEFYEINTRLHRRAFLSVCWFPLVYMVVVIITVLHDHSFI